MRTSDGGGAQGQLLMRGRRGLAYVTLGYTKDTWHGPTVLLLQFVPSFKYAGLPAFAC